MAHVIILAEGYPEGHKNFEKVFNGKIYANGKSKVRIREVKLYTVALNEDGLNEFYADIKPWVRYEGNVREGTGSTIFDKINKMAKWIRRLFPAIKSVEEDISKVVKSPLQEQLVTSGTHLNMWMVPIGKVNDFNLNGKEQV